jgi:hypothetical protein
MSVMFRLWLLEWEKKRALHRIRRSIVARALETRVPEKTAFEKEISELDRNNLINEVDRVNFSIETFHSDELLHEANKLDVKIPFEDPECWRDMRTGLPGATLRILSPYGRSVLRSKIDAEKARRFEVKTLWVTKFWLPLLAALVGIIGAVTGLVAVLHRK